MEKTIEVIIILIVFGSNVFICIKNFEKGNHSKNFNALAGWICSIICGITIIVLS